MRVKYHLTILFVIYIYLSMNESYLLSTSAGYLLNLDAMHLVLTL